MLNEQEFTILKTLVEEEMGFAAQADTNDADIAVKYFMTLSNIVEHLKNCVNDMPSFSEDIRVSVK